MAEMQDTVARNLCADEFHPRFPAPFGGRAGQGGQPLSIVLRAELDRLSPGDREPVLLRCVNGEPMAVMSKLYGQSRFALRRRLNGILKTLRDALE